MLQSRHVTVSLQEIERNKWHESWDDWHDKAFWQHEDTGEITYSRPSTAEMKFIDSNTQASRGYAAVSTGDLPPGWSRPSSAASVHSADGYL